jgi:tetratricopeptide (TPR) repeat protein
LEQGLRLSREIGDEAGLAFVLCNLGLTQGELGQLAAAKATLQEGLRLAENQADKDLASSFYFYLSRVSLQAGNPQQAIEEAQAALALRQELNLSLRMVDDLATLASAHLTLGQLAEALEYARQTLTILKESDGEGPEFPQRAYFIGYQVLAASGQTQQARPALQAAYDVVMTRAANISDPVQRRSFLEQRAMNREIVAEYEIQD